MQETYLTTTQLAKLLTMSPKTLERMRCEGTGPTYYKPGRKVLYSQTKINEWMSENSFKVSVVLIPPILVTGNLRFHVSL